MKRSIPQASPDYEKRRLIERPDGFYWEDTTTGETFGPFSTLLEAANDMESGAEEALEPGEAVREAEDEIGIADWIDPDTGEPAEEQRPRIEDQEH